MRSNWQRAFAVFRPGQLFGYIRWHGNKYGTQDWRFYIAKACKPGPLVRVNGILPGADILLETRGAARTKRALEWIDRLEETDAGLENISPAFWRHAHNALTTGQIPHPISELQYRSFGS